MKRRVIEPSMPDHMHWYRVIGAVYLRERRAKQLDKLASLSEGLDQASEPPSA